MKRLDKIVLALIAVIPALVFASSHHDRGPKENIGGFVAGTIVHTSSGPDTIQNIRVNDRLLSFDTKTGEIVEKRVIKIFQVRTEQLVRAIIGGEEFYLNSDHRLYIPVDSEWIQAKNLIAGTHVVLTKDFNQLLVDEVEVIDGFSTIYDLKVEDTENYFVGENKILVHNFAFVIPVVTWVIGEGLVWATAATVTAAIVYGLAKDASDKNRNRRADPSGSMYRKKDLREIDYIADSEGIDRIEFG